MNTVKPALLNIAQKNGRTLFFGGLLGWLLLNLLQAGLTGLEPDEAYYWLYARYLDWGYFDHPPMVALLIRPGYALIPHELGLRLGTVLIQVASFWGMWHLAGKPTSRQANLTLLLLLAAMPMLHVYGFVATPDGPLLLFTVLFWLCYRNFITQATWPNTLLLGLVMALLLYSKYHGILLIGFTLLSNLRLLKLSQFYLAAAFGCLLFLPHLYWQYTHDFPSFRYHLSGRDDAYELKFTLVYLLNQVLIFSPLLFPFLVGILSKNPVRNPLDRAYLFNILGFWGFFFYTTFKGHVEPQWTVVLTIPLVLWLYRRAQEAPRAGRRIRVAALASVGLLLVARLVLVLPIPGLETPFNNQAWVSVIRERAGDLPVVFENSYRDAAGFQFYTGRRAYTFTNINYRQSQFDIWDWEQDLQNQQVLVAGQGDWSCSDCDTLRPDRRTYLVKTVDSLQVAQKVKLVPAISNPVWTAGQEVVLSVRVFNPYNQIIRLRTGDLPITPWIIFDQPLRHADSVAAQWLPAVTTFAAADSQELRLKFQVPQVQAGTYTYAIGLQTGTLSPTYNSHQEKVVISH